MQISEKLTELLGDHVLLGEPVVCIDQSTNYVHVTTSKGKTFKVNIFYSIS